MSGIVWQLGFFGGSGGSCLGSALAKTRCVESVNLKRFGRFTITRGLLDPEHAMSIMHCRALHSRHPVRHNPALSGLSCACLACIIRTCLRSPAVHPPPLAHLPPHPPHAWGSQSHECRHPSRLLCPARAFGAAEQGADNIAVVRTKVLLDQIGVIRKPCLQCHQTALLVQAVQQRPDMSSTLGTAGD